MTYEEYRALLSRLDADHTAKTAHLNAVSGPERGPMGLTPEHIRMGPDWRAAFAAERAAFAALGALNRRYAKRFEREIRADIQARRLARQAKES